MMQLGMDQGDELDRDPDDQQRRDAKERRKPFIVIKSPKRPSESSPKARLRADASGWRRRVVPSRTHRRVLRIAFDEARRAVDRVGIREGSEAPLISAA
jgi:hypothetical protein